MKDRRASFCQEQFHKIEKNHEWVLEMSHSSKAIEGLFHYIHQLNGVAASYHLDHIGFVTLLAHQLITNLHQDNKLASEDVVDLYKRYFAMLREIFLEGEENFANTKEALHLMDEFKFYLEQMNQDQAA